MSTQGAVVTSPNGHGPAPSGDATPADRITEIASRVLEAVAARLADSVEAVADRISGPDGRPRSDGDDGAGALARLGAGFGVIAARLAEILGWIVEQGTRLVSTATGLLPGGRGTTEDDDAPGDEVAGRRAAAV